MHPAPSVILFTTFSGIGFGMLAWLGLGVPAVGGLHAAVLFATAGILAAGGLCASAFHLGRPERALKAFSQWRSSWLSREAWVSVMALPVMGLYAAGVVFLDVRIDALGFAGAALSVATIVTTSMIYTQLRTVPRWHSPLTPPHFLAYALAGGALLTAQVGWAATFLAVAGILQVAVWIVGDRALARSGTTLGSATGLGPSPRAFESPHTGSNYLTREMVFVLGRKHSARLRIIAAALAFAVPLIALAFPFGHGTAALAILSHLAGTLVARWLFFAEAEHVVGLYYGRGTAGIQLR